MLKGIARTILSAGAISYCTSAETKHIDAEALEVHSGTIIFGYDGIRLFRPLIRPPTEAPDSRYSYDGLIVWHGTV